MVDLTIDEKETPVPSMLQQIAFEDNLIRKLNAIDVVCSALTPEIAKVTEAQKFKKWLNKEFLQNKEFMRKLSLLIRLEAHPETAIELASVDYDSHPEFHYDNEFHAKVADLNQKINHFIGKCIKEHGAGEDIDYSIIGDEDDDEKR